MEAAAGLGGDGTCQVLREDKLLKSPFTLDLSMTLLWREEREEREEQEES